MGKPQLASSAEENSQGFIRFMLKTASKGREKEQAREKLRKSKENKEKDDKSSANLPYRPSDHARLYNFAEEIQRAVSNR